MDYVELDKEYFKQFMSDGPHTIDAYIESRRKDGIWGDNIEILV